VAVCALGALALVWLILLLLWRTGQLSFVRLPSEGSRAAAPPIHRLVDPHPAALPPLVSLRGRPGAVMARVFAYTVQLMFRWPAGGLRPAGRPWIGPLLLAAHLLGLLVLGLAALTLANVSPAVHAVIGKLAL
jgi:hypothetical protein